MKKSIALILAVLMLVPCFVTAASAGWNDPVLGFPEKAAPGYVCVKKEYVGRGDEDRGHNTTEWVYNQAGQPIKKVTVFMTDEFDDLEIEDPDVFEIVYRTETTTFVYDDSGNLVKTSLKSEYYDGKTSTDVYAYKYNANGDIAKESHNYKSFSGYFERSVTVYTYNRKGLLVKRSTKAITEDGTTQEVYRCTYNSAGQPTKETTLLKTPTKTEDRTTAYAYDKNGRVKKISAVVYYDDRLEKTVTAYTYDKNGNVIKTVIGKYRDKVMQQTVAEANSYDSKGRLTKTKGAIKYATGSVIKYTSYYTYGKNGKISKYEKIYQGDSKPTVTIEYTYDKKGNLTKWDRTDYEYGYGLGSDESFEFTYDKNGNLLKEEYSCSGEDIYGDNSTTYTYQKIGA